MSPPGNGSGGGDGLGRFVKLETTPQVPDGLRRFLERPRADRPGERCQMCGEPIADEHSHVVQLDQRQLVCTCRPCYLLFLPGGAGAGKYKSVPDRYLYDPSFTLTDAQWDDLQIPVGMAFFFFNSSMGQSVAFYPSPAGATESLLPMSTWDELIQANPVFSSVEPDVEALLVYRRPEGFECYLVPIDACYELVGRVRLHWRGFDGGEEAWAEINGFFAGLRERSRPVTNAS